MVTLSTLFSYLLLFVLITMIDAFLYEVSFVTAIQIMFDVPMGLGRFILYVLVLLGFLTAIIHDIRMKKSA